MVEDSFEISDCKVNYRALSEREEQVGKLIVNAVWETQLSSPLKLTNKRLGYLINFNVPLIKNSIKRMVL